MKIIDPDRILFKDYPFYLADRSIWVYPVVPLTVKGEAVGWVSHFKDKEGKFVKNSSGELFDFKENEMGYLVEHKYKSLKSPKVITFRAVYEGCKN